MARRKNVRKTKESMNINDVAVLTALAIMVVTMGFIGADGFTTDQNSAGQAYYTQKMVCISNAYGEVSCSTAYIEAKPDTGLISGCLEKNGCIFTCKELETECNNSNTACDIKERFC